MTETPPLPSEVIERWRCPKRGERVWDILHQRRGTVGEVLQDGDADIEFDDGRPPFISKWIKMWVLIDQTPPKDLKRKESSMSKLNQIIAVEKGIKSRVYGEISDLHKAIQKPDLFNGFVRNYEKKEEEGEDLPSEKKRVQYTVDEVLRSVERLSTEWMDVTARKDWTNCDARADIVVDGQVLVSKVPVTYLLFLEKQLTDLRTFAGCLPVLDEGEKWDKDVNSGFFVTEPTSQHRTKKVQKPIVLYPATPEHPAQTQMITEDVMVGYWKQTKQSGAMPKPEKQDLVERVEKLLQAVKQAREEANAREESPAPKIGMTLFNYLMEK